MTNGISWKNPQLHTSQLGCWKPKINKTSQKRLKKNNSNNCGFYPQKLYRPEGRAQHFQKCWQITVTQNSMTSKTIFQVWLRDTETLRYRRSRIIHIQQDYSKRNVKRNCSTENNLEWRQIIMYYRDLKI